MERGLEEQCEELSGFRNERFVMPKKESKTRWRDKLARGEVKIVDIPPKWHKRFGEGKMLIAKPTEVDALIRRVGKGKLATQADLRERLATDAGVAITCPLTTGIFLRVAAEAAEEAAAEGAKRITPWWRIVKDDGKLNPKFPGGWEEQARRLEQEGHKLVPSRGKAPPRVADIEKKRVRL